MMTLEAQMVKIAERELRKKASKETEAIKAISNLLAKGTKTVTQEMPNIARTVRAVPSEKLVANRMFRNIGAQGWYGTGPRRDLLNPDVIFYPNNPKVNLELLRRNLIRPSPPPPMAPRKNILQQQAEAQASGAMQAAQQTAAQGAQQAAAQGAGQAAQVAQNPSFWDLARSSYIGMPLAGAGVGGLYGTYTSGGDPNATLRGAMSGLGAGIGARFALKPGIPLTRLSTAYRGGLGVGLGGFGGAVAGGEMFPGKQAKQDPMYYNEGLTPYQQQMLMRVMMNQQQQQGGGTGGMPSWLWPLLLGGGGMFLLSQMMG